MRIFTKGVNLCKIIPGKMLWRPQNEFIFYCKRHTFHPTFTDSEEKQKLLESFKIIPNFISEKDELLLVKELDPYLKRLKYEKDHWDDAIQGYRETEKKNWKPENAIIVDKIRLEAFENSKTLAYTHVLDLEASGCIKPHVDSIKFCGDTIAGLSLLTDCIMRLQCESNKEQIVDFLLPRRSLYIMTNKARYDYNHAVLGNNECNVLTKGRRISIICRNEP